MSDRLTVSSRKLILSLTQQSDLEIGRRNSAPAAALETYHHGRSTAFSDIAGLLKSYASEPVFTCDDVDKLRKTLASGLQKTIELVKDTLSGTEPEEQRAWLSDLSEFLTGNGIEDEELETVEPKRLAELLAHRILPTPGDAAAFELQTEHN